jgi:threonine/homoserine efflux transporter RhtA
VIGVVVLRQLPSVVDLVGIGLVMLGVVLHREVEEARTRPRRVAARLPARR